MNKYRPNTIKIDGVEVDRTKVISRPIEEDGAFKTSDGQKYQRDKNGCIRKVK